MLDTEGSEYTYGNEVMYATQLALHDPCSLQLPIWKPMNVVTAV